MEIVLKNVKYRYNHRDILNRLSFTLEGSNLVGMMGPHKTLILELIDAVKMPEKGTIRLGKETITKENINKMRKKVALVRQNAKDQFFMQTVSEEMNFIVNVLKYNCPNIEKKMKDALKIVGLDDSYLNRKMTALSSGEKKLVQLAVSLLYNPKIILLDEPFEDLDYTHKKKLLRIIKMLKEKYQKTIIIASNNSDILYSLVEELIILDGKKVVKQGPSDELFKDVELLHKYNIDVPNLIEFTNKAKEKNIRLSYHKDIRDIIKDIYKHVA